MAPAKSTGSGPSVTVAGAASTAAPKPRSKAKGSKPTGGGSKAKGPDDSEILLIFQSAVHLMARVTGTIDVANGTGETLFMRLPANIHICQEPACLRLFLAPVPDNLYCDKHRAAHSTETIVQIPLAEVALQHEPPKPEPDPPKSPPQLGDLIKGP